MKISIEDLTTAITRHLVNKGERSMLAITGGGCAGKSTLAKNVYEYLGEKNSNYLNTDNYLISPVLRKNTKWLDLYNELFLSNNELVNGRLTACCPEATFIPALERDLEMLRAGYEFPEVDVGTNSRSIFKKNLYNIVEGIGVSFVDFDFDLSIFVYCDEEVELKRRLNRDFEERNIGREKIINDFRLRRTQYEVHVHPNRKKYNIIAKSLGDYSILIEKDEKGILY
jgi:uridine kinase